MIVLRTFSKAYGLAAFRVGYAIGHPDVIVNLNKVRSPFNNTTAGLALAEKALDDDEFIKQCRTIESRTNGSIYYVMQRKQTSSV